MAKYKRKRIEAGVYEYRDLTIVYDDSLEGWSAYNSEGWQLCSEPRLYLAIKEIDRILDYEENNE